MIRDQLADVEADALLDRVKYAGRLAHSGNGSGR